MNQLTQDEVVQIFTSSDRQRYRKFGTVRARLAQEGERVVTEIDGKVETTNTASAGDVIVTNPGGEEYIIQVDKFTSRYTGPELTSENQEYEAAGEAFSTVWTGPESTFQASWGEQMIIEPGDMLTSLSEDGMPKGKFGVYRIEKNAFAQTYKQA